MRRHFYLICQEPIQERSGVGRKLGMLHRREIGRNAFAVKAMVRNLQLFRLVAYSAAHLAPSGTFKEGNYEDGKHCKAHK